MLSFVLCLILALINLLSDLIVNSSGLSSSFTTNLLIPFRKLLGRDMKSTGLIRLARFWNIFGITVVPTFIGAAVLLLLKILNVGVSLKIIGAIVFVKNESTVPLCVDRLGAVVTVGVGAVTVGVRDGGGVDGGMYVLVEPPRDAGVELAGNVKPVFEPSSYIVFDDTSCDIPLFEMFFNLR